jgi:soluble lytic murein transglycosylase-like protein
MIPNENKYDDLFQRNSEKYKLDMLLLKAQVKQESRFNPDAKSHVGAQGLAQFMPATWKEWGKGKEITDPEANLDAQARYMRYLTKLVNKKLHKDMSHYRTHWTLACYNWGMGRVLGFEKIINGQKTKIKGVLELFRGDYERATPSFPFETKQYIEKIMDYYTEYKHRDGA